MNAYKIETTVDNNGEINVPIMKNLANHKIEIVILDKSENVISNDENQYKSFMEFSKKWKGCIKGIDSSKWKNDKTDYLEDKYK